MTCLVVAAALAAACGKKKDGGEDKGGAPPTPEIAADCSSFAPMMNQCLESFAAAYAKTEIGGKAGKDTIDGPVDEEKAASRFKMLWGMEGEKLCTGEYQQKDRSWKERFNACATKTTCDDWVPCMATAMGAPMR